MKKNMSLKIEELQDIVEPKLIFNWIKIGKEKGWLTLDEKNTSNIFLSKKYSEGHFALTVSKDGKTVLGFKDNPQLNFFRNAKAIFYQELEDNTSRMGIYLDMKVYGIENPFFIFMESLKDVKDLLELSDIVFLVPFKTITAKNIKLGKVLAKLNVTKGN